MNITLTDTQAAIILELLVANALQPRQTPEVIDLIYQIESNRRESESPGS